MKVAMLSNIGRLAGAAVARPAQEADHRVFASAAAAELRHTAVLTAVAASLVNQMWQAPRRRLPSAITTVVPPTPILVRAALAGLPRADVPAMLAAHDDMAAMLGAVRRIAVDVIADDLNCANATLFELGALLRRLSATTALLVGQAAEAHRRTGAGIAFAEAGQACTLLERCAAGEAPCALVGRPLFPEWYDRRGERRFGVHMAAKLAAGDKLRHVVVSDASRTGLGLRGCIDVADGEPVAIELWSGRLLDGVVAWSNSERAGIELSQPLAYDDPLISTD